MVVEILLPAYFLLLHLSPVLGTLTFYYGKQTVNGLSFTMVRGVAVLNLGGVEAIHFIDCVTSESSNRNLRWTKNEGSRRFSMEAYTYSYQGMIIRALRLQFTSRSGPPVGYGDVGGYTCSDIVTGERTSIHISGNATAVIPVQASVEVILGSTAELNIYAEGDPPLTSNEIEWERSDGTQILNDTRVFLHDSNYRLVIQNVTLQDSGVYRIEIVRESAPASTTIDLDVHVGVEVLSSPASVMVLEHVDVTFTCVFSGNPLPSISWEREGSADLPVQTRRDIEATSVTNDTFIFHTVTSVFTIMGVRYEDEGRYQCIATSRLAGGVESSNASSAFAELSVTQTRILLIAKNPNVIENGLAYVSENSRVEIVCSGVGALSWESSTGVVIPVENNTLFPPFNIFQRFNISTDEQILVIQNFSSANDVAVYTCESDLIIGGITLYEVVFIATSDPAVFIADETIYTAAGRSVNISATVYSSTQNGPAVEWRHEDSPINTTNDTHYSETTMGTSVYILTITNITVDVLGRYTAVVTVGEDTQSDSVQLAFPAITGTTVQTLTENFEAPTAATISLLGVYVGLGVGGVVTLMAVILCVVLRYLVILKRKASLHPSPYEHTTTTSLTNTQGESDNPASERQPVTQVAVTDQIMSWSTTTDTQGESGNPVSECQPVTQVAVTDQIISWSTTTETQGESGNPASECVCQPVTQVAVTDQIISWSATTDTQGESYNPVSERQPVTQVAVTDQIMSWSTTTDTQRESDNPASERQPVTQLAETDQTRTATPSLNDTHGESDNPASEHQPVTQVAETDQTRNATPSTQGESDNPASERQPVTQVEETNQSRTATPSTQGESDNPASEHQPVTQVAETDQTRTATPSTPGESDNPASERQPVTQVAETDQTRTATPSTQEESDSPASERQLVTQVEETDHDQTRTATPSTQKERDSPASERQPVTQVEETDHDQTWTATPSTQGESASERQPVTQVAETDQTRTALNDAQGESDNSAHEHQPVILVAEADQKLTGITPLPDNRRESDCLDDPASEHQPFTLVAAAETFQTFQTWTATTSHDQGESDDPAIECQPVTQVAETDQTRTGTSSSQPSEEDTNTGSPESEAIVIKNQPSDVSKEKGTSAVWLIKEGIWKTKL